MGKKVTLKIENMMCEVCVGKVSDALEKLDGVESADVKQGKAVVKYDETKTDETKLIAAVIDAGFPAKVKKGLF